MHRFILKTMILEDLDYTAYAELLIDTGVNLEKGCNLIIRFSPEGALLARKCAETAYARGAGIVEMTLVDSLITRARIRSQAGNEDALSRFPGWTGAWENTVLKEGWAYLALISHENPGVLADCDQQSLMFYEKSRTLAMKGFREAIGSHGIPWCVASVPGPRWATDVLGSGKSTKDLWEILRPILLLDRDNPAQAWKEKAEILIDRAEKLDRLAIESLHFQSEGTDLRIGLSSLARWKGGLEETKGHRTMPNLPTEEVFTTPDRTLCNGKVRVSRPVEIRGTIVKGAELHFREGVLTDFSAEEGEDALKGYVDTDAGAKQLGEVALVGEDSPIAMSGKIFGSILYDENASCHIALGSGYPTCLEGGADLDTDKKKLKAGCNVSLVHLDFMIGSADTLVTGTDSSGKETVIIREGRFTI